MLEYLNWRNAPPEERGRPDLSMDGLVPEETQRRWAEKVAAARFLEPELARRQQAALDAQRRAGAERAAASGRVTA